MATAPAHLHRRINKLNTKAEQGKTMPEVKRELADLLKRTEYRTYSRAGAPKKAK